MREKNSRKSRNDGYWQHGQSLISAQRMIAHRNVLIAVNSSVLAITEALNSIKKDIAQSLVRAVERPSMCGEIEACLQHCSHVIYANVKVVEGKRHLELRDAIGSILNKRNH